ncbi:MAG TPA: hypothetical protein PLR06_12705, partial [Cyclobacteriaceae bacterium]|nr:hypothetical protein [Cyclobacteriaceae bacterium]
LYGLEVHVLDRSTDGPRADLVRELGAVFHSGNVKNLDFEPDTIIECTGAGQVIAESIQKIGANGIVCLAGIGHGGAAGGESIADVAASAVLRNNVIVGSVNANKRHWYRASEYLARADRKWLAKLITRIEKPENFMNALHRKPNDIKVVIQFSEI